MSVTTLAWGLVPIVIKLTDLPGLTFAIYRLWLGVGVYLAALLVTRRRLTWGFLRLSALGGVFFAADISLAFNAFKLTSIANAMIIGALSPVLITMAAARWFGERIGRREAVLAGLSLAGVVVVAVGSAGTAARSPLGDGLAALSTISWTAYWLYSKRTRARVPALEYMASVMIVGAIVLTPVVLLSGQSPAPPQGQDWFWLILVVLVPGSMGHLLVAWSHRHVEAWLSALITQSIQVVGAVAAWLVLDEPLTPLVVAGGAAVLTATGLIVVSSARRSRAAEAELAGLRTVVERT